MEQRSLEIVAETVEEAVDQGLQKLGVSAAQVIIEVLEEPSAGLFGVGGRPAKVRLNTLAQDPPETASASVSSISEESPAEFEDDHYIPDDFYPAEPAESPVYEDEGDYIDDPVPEAPSILTVDESEWDEELRNAQTVVTELLEQMQIKARVRVGRAGEEENAPWLLSMEGKATGKLVGRRGQALASLQYLARLIVSKRIGGRCSFVLDADHYKMRRADKLRTLAERMANQAIMQRRTLTLEPMPPNERRVIHLTLRNREDVETFSVGEGDGRKVSIAPR
ncbi:MAG: Jag N-terminal domain-containing protein [Anaerolineaceae bacterium]|nr:Jag N-terminal domain-containing protein [Anaerolineaceae bacterium]